MPYIKCLCGERINISSIPNPSGSIVLPEIYLQDVLSGFSRFANENPDLTSLEEYLYSALIEARESKQMYECENCQRIFFERKRDSENGGSWYRLEQ